MPLRRIVLVTLLLLALGAGDAAATKREIMAATGDLAPGAQFDARFTDLHTLAITSDGTAVIWGATDGRIVLDGIPGIVISNGLWTWNSANGLQALKIGALGLDWRSLDRKRIAVGADGRVLLAVSNAMTVDPVDRLLDCHVGQVGCSVLAVTGDTVAGLPDGWTLDHFTSVDLDASGALVFTASLDTGDPEVGASGVFAVAEEVVLVAATGAALAEPSAAVLGVANNHVRSATNTIIFTSSVPVESNGFPIFGYYVLLARWTPATGLEGLLVGGEPAPGGDPGTTFLWPFTSGYDFAEGPISFDVGADGTAAFVASISASPGSGNSGVWICDPASTCALRVREGEHVPGANDGAAFARLWSGTPFGHVVVAPDGTVAFGATFLTPIDENSGQFGYGVFTIEPDGALRTLARTGDPDPARDTEFSGPFTSYVVGPQNRVLFGDDYDGIYAVEPGRQVWSVMHCFDPIDPATVYPVAEFVDFDASDAEVEHAALRVHPSRYGSDVVLLFATLPEPGEFASAAASSLALSALARRRS